MRNRLPLLALALATAAIAVIVLSAGPAGERLTFVFHDAAGLRAGDEVKLGGAPAGHVDSVGVTAAHLALVKVELDHGIGPVGVGASGSVRPTGLLGEPYIDLSVGDPTRPLPAGAVIPASRTTTAELQRCAQ